MSFIRLKKRDKNYYAYLVENKWSRYAPKQKVKLYLGKYIKLNSEKVPENIAKIDLNKDKIFYSLLKNELLSYRFKQKNKDLFIHENGVTVNLKKHNVLKDNKEVCLGLNEGYLCSHTLKELINFKSKSKNKKEEGTKLIKTLLNAGISLNKETFLEIFNKIIKT